VGFGGKIEVGDEKKRRKRSKIMKRYCLSD
jgi:hypothetical protein